MAIESWFKKDRLNEGNYWFDKGNEFYDLDKYEEAIKCYEKAISINDKYSEAHYKIGMSYLGMYGGKNKLEEIVTHFEKAIKLGIPDKYDVPKGLKLARAALKERYEYGQIKTRRQCPMNPNFRCHSNSSCELCPRARGHWENFANYCD